MIIPCIWEHNGNDTLLYAGQLPGAYARGKSLEEAIQKMDREIRTYLTWRDGAAPDSVSVEIVQDVACSLEVCDADSDVLFQTEQQPLTLAEYEALKVLALRSAADFLALYEAIPDQDRQIAPARRTFYGAVPSTAQEMYLHTKSVNAYYFGELDIDADNDGTILDCRRRGFAALEKRPGFLDNRVIEGSYGEFWSLRKVLRRFLWHDRIHAKALYRRAICCFGKDAIPNPFFFSIP